MEGFFSEKFQVTHGVRQGCPLSLLLFDLALEPFATNIKQNPQIKGFIAKQSETKLTLYVDDIICFFENPVASIKEFHKAGGQFGQVSGYNKINESKSICNGFNISV